MLYGTYRWEDKVKIVKLQTLRREFDNLRMKDVESVEDFVDPDSAKNIERSIGKSYVFIVYLEISQRTQKTHTHTHTLSSNQESTLIP